MMRDPGWQLHVQDLGPGKSRSEQEHGEFHNELPRDEPDRLSVCVTVLEGDLYFWPSWEMN